MWYSAHGYYKKGKLAQNTGKRIRNQRQIQFFFLNAKIEDFGHFRPFCRQRCGTVTIFYGSGSDFWKGSGSGSYF